MLFINLLLKSTGILKQDSSKSSSHRAIILGNLCDLFYFSIFSRFFLFLKAKKGQIGISVLFVTAFISYTPRNRTAVKFALLLKYNDNTNIDKATFR